MSDIAAAALPHAAGLLDAVQGRRARLEAQVEAILITDPDNLLWLTGDWEARPERWLLYAGGDWHTVAKPADRRATLGNNSGVEADAFILRTAVLDICLASAVCFPLPIDRGRRWADARVAQTPAQLADGRRIVSELRQYKDSVEIEIMVRNAKAVREALDAAREELRSGMTELDIWDVIASGLRSHNPSSLQVYGNCASGPRTVEADPHASFRVIKEHEPLLLDVYPRINGYFADLTRTWCCGHPTREMGRMIDAVRETLSRIAAIVTPGMAGVDLDGEAKAMLASRGYPDAYGHHTGHGLGVKQQERPWVRRRSPDVIGEGMVIALEPACYVEGIGGVRWEDEYLITSDGAVGLTELIDAQISSRVLSGPTESRRNREQRA